MKNEKGSNELIQMFNQLPSSYSKNEKNDDSDNEDNQQNQKKGKDNFRIPQYAKKEEKNIENEDDYNSDEEDDEDYENDESNAHETHKKVKNVGDSVTDWIARASKCNFQFLKQYFNVTEKIVMKRGSYSLIPFNPYFHNISKEKPDLYGPIWIFNTLIFIIAASGELTSYFHGDKNKSYFEMFVPYSALLIYGVGFGLPFLLFIIMKLFGSKPHLPTIICIYGYSLSSFIPACLISMIPNTTLHIIIFGYATFASTSFSIANYWKDASQYINSRKYFLIAIILIFQIVMYLVIVLYFFGMTKEVQIVKEKIEEIKNITGIGVSNSTLSNSTNSTGLL